jgi:hypothetical protein
MLSSQYGRDAVENVGVCVQVLCRALKRAEEFGENTMPEQDKQECTQKTAAQQAVQGSGRVGCASMTLKSVCRAEVLGGDEEGAFVAQSVASKPVCRWSEWSSCLLHGQSWLA